MDSSSFFPDDEHTHLSQLASEPLNPVAPRPASAEGRTDFRGAFRGALGDPPGPSGSGAAADGAPPVWRPSRAGKIINDPVHGTFRLDPACIDIIDSRHFQRLRRLKQLGLAYQVFPGASHNRFEHSLGVAHLAYRLGIHLWNLQRDELDMDRRDLRVVELAGACHDLGHGPFSHVFDRELLRRKGITNWEHEDMSGKMLTAIIDEKCIDSLREDDIKRVQRMITAAHDGGEGSGDGGGKRWLSEIVANGRNSIDVDKFDYLARDSMYCGVKISCDFNRVMQFTKVIGDEICFKYSEYMNLHELFHSRATMHRQVYTHRKAKAIEFMVVDALLEADSVLRLTDRIWDADSFVQLDDGILELVENVCGRGGSVLGPLLRVEPEPERALAAAQAVIGRLRRRDLYKFCSEALVPQELLDRGRWEVLPSFAQDIVSCYRGSDVRLRPEDVILNEVKIDHSLGGKNPLDHTSFFDDLAAGTSRRLHKDQVSWMVPPCFQEKTLRIYSRNSDPAYVAAVHAAFDEWTKRQFGSQYRGIFTPLKSRGLPPPPPGLGAGAALAGLAAAGGDGGCVGATPAGAATGGGGVKRGRELFPRSGDDDTSPSNLLRTKQRRQVDQQAQ